LSPGVTPSSLSLFPSTSSSFALASGGLYSPYLSFTSSSNESPRLGSFSYFSVPIAPFLIYVDLGPIVLKNAGNAKKHKKNKKTSVSPHTSAND